MAIRKDANTLSAAERAEFVDAILTLKAEGIYDQFVLRHANAIMNAIHRCPAFLPWHRRFLFDLERSFSVFPESHPVSHWNWPSGGANAAMWNDDLLGGNGDAGGVVRTDPSGPASGPSLIQADRRPHAGFWPEWFSDLAHSS